MAGFVGARVIGAVLGFASQLMLARVLPIADVGVVLLGMSAAAFIALAANGGYALLALTELPRLTAHGRKNTSDAFNSVALLDSAIAFLAMCVLGWLLVSVLDLTTGQKTAILFGMLCTPASIALRYNASIATAAKYFKTSYVPDFIFRPLALLLGLIAGALAGWMYSPVAALIVFVAVTYLTAVGQAITLGHERLGFRHLQWPRTVFTRRVRQRAFALTLVSAMMFAFADIVVLIAGFVLPENDVAIVGIAIRLAAIAGFVLQAGQMLVTPDFTQALVRGEKEQVAALLKRVNVTTVAIVLAGLAGALILGEFALGLFGADYRAGYWLLVLFMVGQSLRALGGMNQQILSIHGRQLRTAGSCVFTLIVLACLMVLLCGAYGLNGVGYAVFGAEMIWLLALAIQAQRLCGQRGDLLWVLQRR
jgi:O-antigen/teichoic acid export membrane protein